MNINNGWFTEILFLIWYNISLYYWKMEIEYFKSQWVFSERIDACSIFEVNSIHGVNVVIKFESDSEKEDENNYLL